MNPLLIPLIGNIIDKVFPDKEAQDVAKLKLLELQMSGEAARTEAAKSVIVADAQSDSWITRSYRPIITLAFAGVVIAHYFGYTAPNISAEEYVRLLNLVETVLLGAFGFRSAEKVVGAVMSGKK